MTRLLLVRHATHALVGQALAGRMPGVALSEDGQAQARALGDHIARGGGAQGLLSSPLERCLQTAAPIAARTGVSVNMSEALNEIDCGDWTGQRFDALAADPRWRAWNAERGRAAIPGGETAAGVAARIMGLIGAWSAEDRGTVVFVTHGDVIKFAILSLLGAPLDHHARLAIDPASISTLELWAGGGTLVRSNETVAA